MRRGLIVAVAVVLLVAGWIGVRDWRRGYWTTRGATIERFTIHSALAGRDLHEILVIPSGGGRGRELLVFLHGRSSPPSLEPDTVAVRGAPCPRAQGAGRAASRRRGSQLLARPRRRPVGKLRAARGDPGGACALRRRPAPDRDRRDLDGRVRRPRPGTDRSFAVLRGRRPFACALVCGRRHTGGSLRRRRGLLAERPDPVRGLGPPTIACRCGSTSAPRIRSSRRTRRSRNELRAHGTKVSFAVHGGGHSGWSGRMAEYLRFYVSACA